MWEKEKGHNNYTCTSMFPGSGEMVLLCWPTVSFVGVPVTGVGEEGGTEASRRASSGRDSVCVSE